MLIFDYALTPEPGEYVLVASGARRTVCVYMERDNCAELKPVNEGLAFNLWAYPIGVTPEKGKTVGTILGTLVGSAARGSLRSFAGL
jgi:hypothetical protein